MYLKKLVLENIGPIDKKIEIDLPFHKDLENNDTKPKPKPLILVGANGSGKTILLSYILESLLQFKSHAGYFDIEVSDNQLYKLQSSSYININKKHAYCERSYLSDDNSLFDIEVLTKDLSDFKVNNLFKNFNNFDIENDRFSQHGLFLNHTTDVNICKKAIDESVLLYFPPNRFEIPAWLNNNNKKNNYQTKGLIKTINESRREIIINNNLKQIENWFMRVNTDGLQCLHPTIDDNTKQILGQSASFINEYLKKIVQKIFNKNEIQYVVFNRKNSFPFSIRHKCPSIHHLSSGEIALYMIFASILRDFDLITPLEKKSIPDDIQGIVIIDEIDLHIHPTLQVNALPQLIKLFPGIQFIITTHSPLFLLGMDELKKIDNSFDFKIVRLPDGDSILTEEYDDFKTAFESYKKSSAFEKELDISIQKELAELKPNKLLIIEDKNGVKIWEHYLKEYEISDVKVLSSDGCDSNACEHFVYKTKELSKNYNPKIYRLIDRDGIPLNLIKQFEDNYNEKFKNLNYKFNLLKICELESFILQDRFFEKTDFHNKHITDLNQEIETIYKENELEIMFRENLKNRLYKLLDKKDYSTIEKHLHVAVKEMEADKQSLLKAKKLLSILKSKYKVNLDNEDFLIKRTKDEFPLKLNQLLLEIKEYFTEQ